MPNYSKLLYPYQTIRLIKPFIYRIGISDIVKDRLYYDYKVNNNFSSTYKKRNANVNYDEILSTIFNIETNIYYLFYTPYRGCIVNVNYDLLINTNKILKQYEEENWLFDIHINPNLDYITYS